MTRVSADGNRCQPELNRLPLTIASIVAELTDDKSLPKAERKRLQIEHAQHMSAAAGMVKLADKICNLRDVGGNPPADWSEARKREYFDWANSVVAGLPSPNPVLRRLFEDAYAQAATSVV